MWKLIFEFRQLHRAAAFKMAFSVETQASQNRPKSESNNSIEQSKNTNNNCQNNISDYTYGTNSNSNHTEYRKSQRYNIDDPGASTSTGNNIRGARKAEQRGNNWRENLLVKLQLLAEENRENSAYEGFAYVDAVKLHNDTNCYKYAAESKNHTNQGAHALQQQQQQQEQQDRAERASNSSYQNTLFTWVGTNNGFFESCFDFSELFSKLYDFGDSIPYRDANIPYPVDWDNIPTRTVLEQLSFASKPGRERPNGRSTDCSNGDANGPGFEHAPDSGINGWYTVDRCRHAVPPGYEWSNAYCYS